MFKSKWFIGFIIVVLTITGFVFVRKIKKSVDQDSAEIVSIQNSLPDEKVAPKENPSGVIINRDGIATWLSDYGIEVLPKRGKIIVCSGYSCFFKTPYRWTNQTIVPVKEALSRSKTAEEERENIAVAIRLMKEIIGEATCTIQDTPGNPILGNTQRCQMNHDDETVNTTQYLFLLADLGYIKFHHINKPEQKKWYTGAVPSFTDIETMKHYNIDYDQSGKPVVTER